MTFSIYCKAASTHRISMELARSAENEKQLTGLHSDRPIIFAETPAVNELTSRMQRDIICRPSHPATLQTSSSIPVAKSNSLSLLPDVPGIQVPLLDASHPKVIAHASPSYAAEPEPDTENDKKREKEHKKRSKNWTRPETLKLIQLRSQLASKFARIGRKSELWDGIAEALQSRDAQQCRDKWEKLMAGYKEVRDGLKERKDNPFFDELHPLLSGNSSRREKEREGKLGPQENPLDVLAQQASSDTGEDFNPNVILNDVKEGEGLEITTEEDDVASERVQVLKKRTLARKRKRGAKFATITDLHAVQALLETVVSAQQRFFGDLLDAMERREQVREQMRQERENKWRAEERAQRCIFNNAMLILTQKLVGERAGATPQPVVTGSLVGSPVGQQGPKKRSKNWKRTEVLQLIQLRGEMESKFAKSTRRAALWDELAELLGTQGVQRDGKQCKEKWDKLMSEHKDVLDGKREEGGSPYFTELTAVVGRQGMLDKLSVDLKIDLT